MNDDKTSLFDVDAVHEKEIESILVDVYESLEERGYNPSSQIAGYLLSGDPGYISSHNEARNKITKLERASIMESLLKSYMKDKL